MTRHELASKLRELGLRAEVHGHEVWVTVTEGSVRDVVQKLQDVCPRLDLSRELSKIRLLCGPIPVVVKRARPRRLTYDEFVEKYRDKIPEICREVELGAKPVDIAEKYNISEKAAEKLIKEHCEVPPERRCARCLRRLDLKIDKLEVTPEGEVKIYTTLRCRVCKVEESRVVPAVEIAQEVNLSRLIDYLPDIWRLLKAILIVKPETRIVRMLVPEDITATAVQVLKTLAERGGVSVQELCSLLYLSPTEVRKVLSVLQDLGLVEVKPEGVAILNRQGLIRYLVELSEVLAQVSRDVEELCKRLSSELAEVLVEPLWRHVV